jgi:hypothetical protein
MMAGREPAELQPLVLLSTGFDVMSYMHLAVYFFSPRTSSLTVFHAGGSGALDIF